MVRPIQVEARDGYRIWLRYADDIVGEVDLSSFAGKGVFSIWDDRSCFEQVHVSDHGSIAWTDDVELCADSLYLQLTRMQPDVLFECGLPPAIHA